MKKQTIFDQDLDINEGYYTVGTYWDYDKINWYLNNNIVRQAIDDIPQLEGWLYLTHGCDKGDNDNDPSNDQRIVDNMINAPGYDSKFIIDYVRVYELNCPIVQTNLPFGPLNGWNNQNERPRFLADIDGDDKKDIIGFGYLYTRASLSKSDGRDVKFTNQQEAKKGFTIEQGWFDQNTRPRFIADIDGDNKEDIIGFGYEYTQACLSNCDPVSKTVLFGLLEYEVPEFTQQQNWLNMNVHPRYLVDINNDGKADIVGFKDNGVYIAVSTSTHNNASFVLAKNPVLPDFGTNSGWTDNNVCPRMITDLNGDGFPEIIGFNARGVYVSFNRSGVFLSPVLLLSGEFNYSTNKEFPRILADVNGDGANDIIGFGYDGTYVSLFNSYSNTFFAPHKILDHYSVSQGWKNNIEFPRMVIDIDNDRKADIVGFNSRGVEVAISKAETYNPTPVFYKQNLVFENFTDFEGWHDQEAYPRFIGDINDDDFNDIIGLGYYNVHSFVGFNPNLYLPKSSKITSSNDLISEPVKAENYLIFPNPTNGEFEVTSLEKISTIEVYDIKGALLQKVENVNSNHSSINLSDLLDGIYIVKIYNDNIIETKKLVKKQ